MFGSANMFEVILKHLLANKAPLRLRVGNIHRCLPLPLRRVTLKSPFPWLQGGRILRIGEVIQRMIDRITVLILVKAKHLLDESSAFGLLKRFEVGGLKSN